MGEVYRARDLTLDRDVGLKVIASAAAVDDTAVRRFLREAQAASALNHPNIVSVFDVGDCETGPYIVMELVEGHTLRSLLHTAPGPETLKRVGSQVARALAAAHAAGIVHRDIKPDNVMVRSDGYVKVLDFGLARTMRAPADDDAETVVPGSALAAVTGRGEVLGTVAYMSPEQARGEPVNAASDIFSLGIAFYELVTGRHPFDAEAKVSMVARMLSEDPVPPSHLVPDSPPALDALIGRMLDRNPRLRPDAGSVEAALETIFRAPGRAPRPVVPVVRHTVGRESARGELERAFDAAEAGHGALVALSGEPGIGKTTLAEDFVRDLVAAGRSCYIARGRCSERQAGSGAYLPWLEVLDSLRDESGNSVGRLMKTIAPTWHAQVAPLDADDSPEVRALTVNRAGSQEWMKRELCAFLEEIARHRPVVLFFDDLHWADDSTVDLLAYLAARLASQRILAIATYRPSDLLFGRHVFLPLKLELESRGLCRDVRVEFLTGRDVQQYLDLEFPGHRFPAAFASLVHDKTEGNPLFMTDLVRSFRERGVIRLEDGVWHLAQVATAVERDIPASIRSMIELKVARLEDGDRRLLTAASVQGYEFDSAVVSSALGLDRGEVEDRLEALGRVHALVQPVREEELPDHSLSVRYRFVHVLYQNALYASLGPSRRASLSLRVADAVMTLHGAHGRAAELAYLFEAARDFSRAAEFFLIASEKARQVFADREALALAERGMAMLQALPDTPERVPRELMHLMGLALPMHGVKGYAAPELEATYRRTRQLCDQLGENPQLFGSVCGIGAFHFMRAELQPANEAIEQMRRLSELTGDPVMSIWFEWAHGATYSHFGRRLSDTMRHLDRGVSLYDPAMHPGFMLMTGFDAGIGCAFQGARVAWMLGEPDRASERINRTVEQARGLRHPLMIAFALHFQSWIRQHARDPEGVLAVTAETLPLSEQYGYPHVGAWARVVRGWALAQTGRAAEGEAMIRQALTVLDAIGITLMRPNFLALLAESIAAQARVDEALATLAEARAIAERTEERCYLSEIHRLHGELLMRKGPSTAGEADAIERVLGDAVAVARDQEARGFELRARTTLARFLKETGRAGEAWSALGDIVASFTEGFDTRDFRDARSCLDAA